MDKNIFNYLQKKVTAKNFNLVFAKIENRIKLCEKNANRMHTICGVRMSYKDEIPYLYAIKGHTSIMKKKKAIHDRIENIKRTKNNIKQQQRDRNRLYREAINDLMCSQRDECYLEKNEQGEYKYNTRRYFEFFFPIKLMSKRGNLSPIMGFTHKSACAFINYFIIAEKNYPNIDIYDIVCRHRITGKEFVKSNIRNYMDLFLGLPKSFLYTLYTYQQPGSKAVGCGEYLLHIKLNNTIKSSGPDVCCKDGVRIEMKAHSGRLDCQKKPELKNMNECLIKVCGEEFADCTMLEDGMINIHDRLERMGYSRENIIRLIAVCSISSYQKYLSEERINFFIENTTENWSRFYPNGNFDIDSIYRINLCTAGYAYSLLEDFSHLMISSKLPDIKHKNDFNVRFRIFDKDEFTSTGSILSLLENKLIYTDGLLKENSSRDTSPHVYCSLN